MSADSERQRALERSLAQFEGLIAETARQIIATGVELEVEDVKQMLKIKAWRAIERYDAARDRNVRSMHRFVFACIYNLRKDIEKRPRRRNHSIDELRVRAGYTHGSEPIPASDWFDARYLSVDAETVYFEVEDEEVALPCTLSPIERQVVLLRLRGMTLIEIDRFTGLSRPVREAVMHSIRAKLADWAPTPQLTRADAEPERRAPRAARQASGHSVARSL